MKHRAGGLQERRCGRMQPLRSGTGMKSAAESRPNFSLGQRRRRNCRRRSSTHRRKARLSTFMAVRRADAPARVRQTGEAHASQSTGLQARTLQKSGFCPGELSPGQKPLRSRCACCRIQSQLVKAPASCRFRAFSGVRYILFVTNTALRHHFRHMCPIHTIITAIPPAPRLRPHR